MTTVFTSDIHGSASLYDQIGQVVARERAELLILGGDLFRDGDGDNPAIDQQRQVGPLLARIASWRRSSPRLAVAFIGGNHDWRPTLTLLSERGAGDGVSELTMTKTLRCDGVSIIGYGCAPWSPHTVKDFERLDLPDDAAPSAGGVVWDDAAGAPRPVTAEEHYFEQKSMWDELNAATTPAAPWVLVSHAPPYDCGLDELPEHGKIGSRAVRRFVEQRQPSLCLCGHVHQGPELSGRYAADLGTTLCINPGQGDDGALHAVTFDLHDPRSTLRHTRYG